MNRDDIIRMALEADFRKDNKGLYGTHKSDITPLLERFAALVAAEKDKETDALRRELMLAKGCSHPGYVIGMHWLASAYHRICAGEPEREVMIDYGYVKERDE